MKECINCIYSRGIGSDVWCDKGYETTYMQETKCKHYTDDTPIQIITVNKEKHQEKVCRNCTHLLKVFAREDMWYECFLMNSYKYHAPTVELGDSCKMFKQYEEEYE